MLKGYLVIKITLVTFIIKKVMKKLIILTAAMFLFSTCEKVNNPPIIEVVSPRDGKIYFKEGCKLYDIYEIRYIPVTISVTDHNGWIEKASYKLTNTDTGKIIEREIKNKDYDGFYSSKIYPSSIEPGNYIFEVMAIDDDNIKSIRKSKFLVLEL